MRDFAEGFNAKNGSARLPFPRKSLAGTRRNGKISGMNDSENAPDEAGFFSWLRKAFFTGLFVCLPVTLTACLIVWLVNLIAAPARGIFEAVLKALDLSGVRDAPFFHVGVTLVSALCVAAFLVLIGHVSRHVFGKWFLNLLDGVFRRLPMVSSVYAAVKQVIDTFGAGKKQTFSKVALVEFPRAGAWTFAFLTHEKPTKLCAMTGEKLVHLFVPTTPNPTGGYMIFVPEKDVRFLDVSVAEAMKTVVSGGAVVPANLLDAAEASETPESEARA